MHRILPCHGQHSAITPVCVPCRSTQNCYALKVIDKHLVLRHKQMEYVRNERYVLDKTNYEGVVNLHFTFQDDNSLYLGLELCPNGGVLTCGVT